MTKIKYKWVYGKRGHPMANKRGRIYKHRYVMSEFLGRPLLKSEIVHHKNGNIHHNRIENLELFSTVADHTKKHNPGGNISTIKVECFCCGKVFEKELRVFKAQKKSGQTRFYCNRVCMGRCNATKNFRRGEVIHGSSTSYQYWKCRCNICRTAHAERRRQWYAKRKNLGVLV